MVHGCRLKLHGNTPNYQYALGVADSGAMNKITHISNRFPISGGLGRGNLDEDGLSIPYVFLFLHFFYDFAI